MPRRSFYNREMVERRAVRDLNEYQRRAKRDLTLPIDAELVGDVVYGLCWDWEEIEEQPGERVLAALYVGEARAALNVRHMAYFEEKPGLEQYTRGHEVGHAALHVDPGRLGQPADALSAAEAVVLHRDVSGRPSDPGDYWMERQADWYAASLLMPADLFVPHVQGVLPANWGDVRELANRFGVTPTAANYRLRTLKMPHCASNGSWTNPQVEAGQLGLF